MPHCLVTEAVNDTLKHPLLCGAVFGDVTAVFSKVANRYEFGEWNWVADDLELERAPSGFFLGKILHCGIISTTIEDLH